MKRRQQANIEASVIVYSERFAAGGRLIHCRVLESDLIGAGGYSWGGYYNGRWIIEPRKL